METSSSFLRRQESRTGRSIDWTAPFSLAMVVLLAVLVLLPMYWLTVTSLTDDTKSFTFAHYKHFVDDPSFIKPLYTTMWTSAAVGILCVLFAAPMGWLVARTNIPFKVGSPGTELEFAL